MHQYEAEQGRKTAQLEKMVQRMGRRLPLAKVFSAWVTFTLHHQALEVRARRVVGKLSNRSTASAFARWRQLRQQMMMYREIKRRLGAAAFSRAFSNWRAATQVCLTEHLLEAEAQKLEALRGDIDGCLAEKDQELAGKIRRTAEYMDEQLADVEDELTELQYDYQQLCVATMPTVGDVKDPKLWEFRLRVDPCDLIKWPPASTCKFTARNMAELLAALNTALKLDDLASIEEEEEEEEEEEAGDHEAKVAQKMRPPQFFAVEPWHKAANQFVAGVPFRQMPRLGLIRLVRTDTLPYDEQGDAMLLKEATAPASKPNERQQQLQHEAEEGEDDDEEEEEQGDGAGDLSFDVNTVLAIGRAQRT